ncbi:MAG: methionine--tRNA ligase [Candidatus Aenigmatarchaeota archaeon]
MKKKSTKERTKPCHKITITSAIPYVNGVKHLGNLVGSLLPADIFHRFYDLFEIENIYICGTDEHGTQTEIAAKKEGMTPEEYATKYHQIQKEIYQKWNFDFTYFGRTSSKIHTDMTKDFFDAIYKNGYIVENEITLPYCKNCKMFLADRFIEGICPDCGFAGARGDQCENCGKMLDPTDLKESYCVVCGKKDIIFKKEKHLFLDLSKIEPDLKAWIFRNKHWPVNTRNLALGWIKDGLKPRCITRNLKWGVNVPLKGYKDLVFYVWFDAPIGYISFTKEWNPKEYKSWWKGSKIYHFLGKDNIPFHTIFWPGEIMATRSRKTDFDLPYYVAGYEYLNWEGKKFSTSRGVGLFSDEALDIFPTDYWRYYLTSILPEKKDSNFDWTDFQNRINNELIASYGNLFFRVTSFIEKYFNNVPRPSTPGEQEKNLEKIIKQSIKSVRIYVEKVRIKEALQEIMILSNELNKYLQVKEPWFAIRTNKKDAATTIYHALNGLAVVTLMLWPFIPKTSEIAQEYLGIKGKKWKDIENISIIEPDKKVRSIILFQKVEDDAIVAAKRIRHKGE